MPLIMGNYINVLYDIMNKILLYDNYSNRKIIKVFILQIILKLYKTKRNQCHLLLY